MICLLSALLATVSFIGSIAISIITISTVVAHAQQDSTIVGVLSATNNHSTFINLLRTSKLLDKTWREFGPCTVFGPTDEGFNVTLAAKLATPEYSAHLEDVLQYHITTPLLYTYRNLTLNQTIRMVNEQHIMVTTVSPVVTFNNDATIIESLSDQIATNGIVQSVNAVLLPFSMTHTVMDAAVMTRTSELSTFVKLVQLAGMQEILQEEGPWTVFAPSNEAFAKLDPTVSESLKAPENKDALEALLNYHIYPGILIFSPDKGDASVIQFWGIRDTTVTRSGNVVKINADNRLINGVVLINDIVNVTVEDLLVSNGVIHVIDAVLLQPFYSPEGTKHPYYSEDPEGEDTVSSSGGIGMSCNGLLITIIIAMVLCMA